MKKILLIAKREFLATAGTRAFILGILITPLVIGSMIFLLPKLTQKAPPKVEGEVAIVDPTGQVVSSLQTNLRPEALAKRRQEEVRRVQEALMPSSGAGGGDKAAVSNAVADQAIKSSLGEVPRLEIRALDAGIDLAAAKRPLTETVSKDMAGTERLVLLVVQPDAVVRAPGRERFGTYDLFVRAKLDDRVIGEINNAMRDALVEARIRLSGLDQKQIDALTNVERVQSRTVTASGEGATNRTLNMLMPFAMMGLLLMSVFMSGVYLMTSTVEEKTNRVMEVLLSAVSPMELMTGKILGQLAVGLIVLVLYLGLGVVALISFAALGMLDPMLIVYMFAFFLVAYVSVGAFMAAIGSAVNEMRDAQGLMTPVTIMIMVPWLLWMPISRDPNSLLAVVLSFVPPIGSFVMVLRLASQSPPPAWQAVLAIVVGAGGAYALVWFASKVFRIGMLMYGKPPSFATLIKWTRAA